LRWIRRLLNPLLKLLFNPNPLIHVLHLQGKINEQTVERLDRRETLQYEVITNLVLELTRLGIETRNLKMRVESLSTRLDFDERRGRALEGVVQYRPSTPASPPADAGPADSPEAGEAGGEDADAAGRTGKRRRRRRGRRRGPGEESSLAPGGATLQEEDPDRTPSPPEAEPAAAPDRPPSAREGGDPAAQ
jgi:hypothetical protein